MKVKELTSICDKDSDIFKPTPTYHRRFGQHSNIPKCCIEYFIKVILSQQSVPSIGKKWNYMPCPKCLKNNTKNKLHRCTIKCVPFLREIEANTYANWLVRRHKKQLKKREQIKAQNYFKRMNNVNSD